MNFSSRALIIRANSKMSIQFSIWNLSNMCVLNVDSIKGSEHFSVWVVSNLWNVQNAMKKKKNIWIVRHGMREKIVSEGGKMKPVTNSKYLMQCLNALPNKNVWYFYLSVEYFFFVNVFICYWGRLTATYTISSMICSPNLILPLIESIYWSCNRHLESHLPI